MTTKVGIIGMGVMGGSLLLNLKASLPDVSIHAISRGESGQQWARDNGAESAGSNILDLPHDLDFLFLTSPSNVLESQAQTLKKWPGKALISDMASAKGWIVPRLDDILKDRYLSCHPMCGSEKTGTQGAKEDLYNRKAVILTPGPSSTKEALEVLSVFWEKLGCRISIKTPEDHDQAVAWVSHMPHLVVPAILQAIRKAEGTEGSIFDIAGTGLRDVSRLAGSNPELWSDIFLENKMAVREAIQSMQEELQVCLDMLEKKEDNFTQEMGSYLQDARAIRQNMGLSDI
jgi:prephenate dehydrogenase